MKNQEFEIIKSLLNEAIYEARNADLLNIYFIRDAYMDIKPKGYLIQYGNSKHGYCFPDNIFTPYLWKRCVKLCIGLRSDISLWHNGKLIRSIWNFNKKVTDKPKFDFNIPYTVNKYQ